MGGIQTIWIPGLHFVPPGMTIFYCLSKQHSVLTPLTHNAFFRNPAQITCAGHGSPKNQLLHVVLFLERLDHVSLRRLGRIPAARLDEVTDWIGD